MASRTNIAYFVLDGNNDPSAFAAVDAEAGDYVDVENLDPQTQLVRSGFTNVSAVDAAARTVVTDNSGTWNTGSAPSAAGFEKWNQTTTDVASVSGNIATNTAAIAVLDDDVDVLGGVSANIATNAAAIAVLDDDVDVLGAVSANIATNTGNISTNLGKINVLDDDVDVLGAVSGNIATNAAAIAVLDDDVDVLGAVSGNIATNAAAIAVLDDDVDVLGGVSANIATNTGAIASHTTTIGTNSTNIATVINSLSPVSGTIATNTAAIGVLDDDVDVLGAVSANIATNAAAIAVLDDDVDVVGSVSANIATNAAAIAVLDDDVDVLGAVSANIATNTGNISTLNTSAVRQNHQVAQLGSVSANIATNAAAIAVLDDDVDVVGAVSANIATNTAAIAVLDDDVDVLGAVSANIATNATNIGTNSTVITSGLTHGYAALSGTMQLTRGSGNLSAVDVSAAGEATVNNAVPTFNMGANKISWKKPAFTINPGHTAIEIPDDFGDNLTVNFMTGGTAKLLASGIEAKSIETGAFTANNVTASAYALEVGTSLGCPIPNPFGYIQLTSDDAASSDEKHVGYSNTPTSVLSNTDHISWDDSAKNFVVKYAGTYEVVARIFFEGGSTLIEMHINKEGSPVNTANPRAHTTVDPVERTISAIFTCAVDDVVDVTYEATSAQTTAAQIGTTVTIKRLK
jgi:hypothetical protein